MSYRLPSRLLCAAVGLVFCLAAGRVQAIPLVGVTADGLGGTLYDVSPTTGALSNPRPVIGGLGGLTYLTSGQLVATRHYSGDFALYQIDPLTGAESLLVPFPTSVIEGGVVQDPSDGTLYAVNMDPGGGGIPGLFSIDLGAGTTTFIGSVFDTSGSGGSMDLSALAFDATGRLWAVRDISALQLVEIDKYTGTVLSFQAITGGLPVSLGLAGLALNPTTGHFFFSYNYSLYDLDPTTGAATLIGSTAYQALSGLAYQEPRVTPEPGLLWMLAGAGAFLGVRGRQET